MKELRAVIRQVQYKSVFHRESIKYAPLPYPPNITLYHTGRACQIWRRRGNAQKNKRKCRAINPCYLKLVFGIKYIYAVGSGGNAMLAIGWLLSMHAIPKKYITHFHPLAL